MFKTSKIDISFLYTLAFLMLCWMLFLSEEYIGYGFSAYGLRPRTPESWYGVFSMHFLHGGWKHIANNSLSFVVLNTMLFYYYKEIAWKVFVWVMLGGGVILWFIGAGGNHIGASLIIFGEASFLFFSGVFRDHKKLLRISLVVAFFYGSMVWYVLPVDQKISWEGHLSGAFVGLAAAFLLRKQGPKREKYAYEIEEEWIEKWKAMDDSEIEVVDVQEFRLPVSKAPAPQPRVQVTYDYKKKKPTDQGGE